MMSSPVPATAPSTAPRPAWKEPLVWMVWGIPALTVVAGLTTWWIAAQRADSDVADDHYRRGLAVNRVLQREERARMVGVEAEVNLSASAGPGVRLGGLARPPEALVLLLTHPVSKDQDRRVALAIQPDGSYRPQDATSPAQAMPVGGNWNIALEGDDWRLVMQRVSLQGDTRLLLTGAGGAKP